MSGVIATRALVIHRVVDRARAERLHRMLVFFGVPADLLDVADVGEPDSTLAREQTYAVLGAVGALAAAQACPAGALLLRGAATLYAYADGDRDATCRALSVLTGTDWVWRTRSPKPASVAVTSARPDFTGPMSGVVTRLEAPACDGAVEPDAASAAVVSDRAFIPIVSVDGIPVFARVSHEGVPLYFSASAAIVDIDDHVRGHYYDVKDHFLSAVPAVMFITWAFATVMWRPGERGACLIIDDPLLTSRYGCCDFTRLRDLMRQHRFTTNIAFIPWNWRRTTRDGSALFRRDPQLFSVSVHGCDHAAAEFGVTSIDELDRRATLAQARMSKHRDRTRIDHEPIMVFPQGVFSSPCPEVLKRNGFIAAVNTEIAPIDQVHTTRLRDVWDVAVLAYGSFPIYTRRYGHHGIENFAFDLLLGKSTFIVAHHDFFRDGGAALVELVTKLSALADDLRWRSPLDVIRRSYRRRHVDGIDHYEMYASELVVPRSARARVRVRRREASPSSIAEVEWNGQPVAWEAGPDALTCAVDASPEHESLVTVRYKRLAPTTPRLRRSLRYEVTVAARRLLSEVRDEYMHGASFLASR